MEHMECMECMECTECMECMEYMECMEHMEHMEHRECMEHMECMKCTECMECMECTECMEHSLCSLFVNCLGKGVFLDISFIDFTSPYFQSNLHRMSKLLLALTQIRLLSYTVQFSIHPCICTHLLPKHSDTHTHYSFAIAVHVQIDNFISQVLHFQVLPSGYDPLRMTLNFRWFAESGGEEASLSDLHRYHAGDPPCHHDSGICFQIAALAVFNLRIA